RSARAPRRPHRSRRHRPSHKCPPPRPRTCGEPHVPCHAGARSARRRRQPWRPPRSRPCCCCRRREWRRRAARSRNREPSARSPPLHYSRAAARRCGAAPASLAGRKAATSPCPLASVLLGGRLLGGGFLRRGFGRRIGGGRLVSSLGGLLGSGLLGRSRLLVVRLSLGLRRLGRRLLGRGLLGGLGVVIVVMAAARAVDVQRALFAFDRGFQILAAHGTLADLGLLEEIVDDLVLIERRTKLGGGERFLLDIFDEALAVLRRILLRGLSDQAVHFLLGDFHTIGLADLGEQQAEAHATLGDLAIILAVV